MKWQGDKETCSKVCHFEQHHKTRSFRWWISWGRLSSQIQREKSQRKPWQHYQVGSWDTGQDHCIGSVDNNHILGWLYYSIKLMLLGVFRFYLFLAVWLNPPGLTVWMNSPKVIVHHLDVSLSMKWKLLKYKIQNTLLRHLTGDGGSWVTVEGGKGQQYKYRQIQIRI